MKGLMKMITAALNAVRTVMVKCGETGKWIAKTVVSPFVGGGAPEAGPGPLEQLEGQIAAQALADVPAAGDAPTPVLDGYDRIQRVCRVLSLGEDPDEADLAALSSLQREWIEIMPRSMRLVVGNVDKQDLRAHMRGTKGLKGVIPCDTESLADWRHSVEIEAAIIAGGYDYQPDAPAPRMTMH